MFDSMKSKVLGAGLGLALVGSAIGGIAATSAQMPPSTQATQSQTVATPQTEAADTPGVAETPEANELLLPGGGHADAAGVDAQHDFQGVE